MTLILRCEVDFVRDVAWLCLPLANILESFYEFDLVAAQRAVAGSPYRIRKATKIHWTVVTGAESVTRRVIVDGT